MNSKEEVEFNKAIIEGLTTVESVALYRKELIEKWTINNPHYSVVIKTLKALDDKEYDLEVCAWNEAIERLIEGLGDVEER